MHVKHYVMFREYKLPDQWNISYEMYTVVMFSVLARHGQLVHTQLVWSKVQFLTSIGHTMVLVKIAYKRAPLTWWMGHSTVLVKTGQWVGQQWELVNDGAEIIVAPLQWDTCPCPAPYYWHTPITGMRNYKN